MELALTWLGLNLVSLHYIHMLQLESYQPDGYMRHLMRYRAEWQGVTLLTGAVCLAAQLILPTIIFPLFTGERVYSMIISRVLIMAFYAFMCGREGYRFFTAKPKKPLVYTKRCKRLIAANAAVTLLCVALLALIVARFDSSDRQTMLMWVSPMALIAALPFIVYLSSRAILPVENGINEGYKRAAREKLAKNPKLVKVAITGSFGKTGTKYALGTILEGKYKTYISPLISDQLRILGISISVSTVSKSTLQKRLKNGDFEMVLCGMNLSVMPDLTFLLNSQGRMNYSGYSSADMNSLLRQLYDAKDETSFKAVMSQIQLKIAEDLPFLGLFFRKGTLMTTSQVSAAPRRC